MHTELTFNLVRLDLQFDTHSKLDAKGTIVTDAKGKIVFEPNTSRTPFIDCKFPNPFFRPEVTRKIP